jgi:hypothetical protein
MLLRCHMPEQVACLRPPDVDCMRSDVQESSRGSKGKRPAPRPAVLRWVERAVYRRARDRIGHPQLQRAILGTMNLFILITSFQPLDTVSDSSIS